MLLIIALVVLVVQTLISTEMDNVCGSVADEQEQSSAVPAAASYSRVVVAGVPEIGDVCFPPSPIDNNPWLEMFAQQTEASRSKAQAKAKRHEQRQFHVAKVLCFESVAILHRLRFILSVLFSACTVAGFDFMFCTRWSVSCAAGRSAVRPILSCSFNTDDDGRRGRFDNCLWGR